MPSPNNDWTDRTVRGPVAEFLTPEEFRKLFGLSDDMYDRLRGENRIPAPIRYSGKVMKHPWDHAVLFSIWERYATDLREGVKGKESEK